MFQCSVTPLSGVTPAILKKHAHGTHVKASSGSMSVFSYIPGVTPDDGVMEHRNMSRL
jgi:hypothetical protein